MSFNADNPRYKGNPQTTRHDTGAATTTLEHTSFGTLNQRLSSRWQNPDSRVRDPSPSQGTSSALTQPSPRKFVRLRSKPRGADLLRHCIFDLGHLPHLAMFPLQSMEADRAAPALRLFVYGRLRTARIWVVQLPVPPDGKFGLDHLCSQPGVHLHLPVSLAPTRKSLQTSDQVCVATVRFSSSRTTTSSAAYSPTSRTALLSHPIEFGQFLAG